MGKAKRMMFSGSILLLSVSLGGWLFLVRPGTAATAPDGGAALHRALDMLETTLSDGSSRLQKLSFTALSEYHCSRAQATKKCAALVSEAARHRDWEVRLMNLPNAFLPAVPKPLRRHVVEEAAHDTSPYRGHIHRTISKLLAQHADASEKGLLTELAGSADLVVREHAAAGLVRLGESKYLRVLEQGLSSENEEVLLEAAAHLVELQGGPRERAEKILRDMLTNFDEVTRANAIYGLSELQSLVWRGGEVQRSLEDESAMVRGAMISVLPAISLDSGDQRGDPMARFDLLIKRWPREPASGLRIEILNAVAAMRRSGAVPLDLARRFVDLVLQNEAEDSHVRLVAMGIVADDRKAAYRTQLLDVASNPKRTLSERLISVSSLGHSGDLTLVSPLTEMMDAQDEAGPDFRIGCAAAIVRICSARGPTGLERL